MTMIPKSLYILSCLVALAGRVTAHGQVTGIVAGGKYYQGYVPSQQGSNPHPHLAGWSIPKDSSNGPVYPSGYGSPNIICHVGAIAGAVSVQVEAGSTVEMEWTPWPVTHHGPVLDYLANCNGPCETADKSSLKFNKIDAVGLIGESTGPGAAGFWGADKMREANNTWTVIIPSTIAEGNYVLRHEIIALHDARTINGAQNYPHCINLQVTGSGTDSLASGTLGTALYKAGDPGIEIDIYKPMQYSMPGPPLYKAGATVSTETSGGSGLGGGLNNLGMGGAVSVASESPDPTSGAAAANVVSVSIPIYSSTQSVIATTTPAALPPAPYSNSTGTNLTTTPVPTPTTIPTSLAAALSSSSVSLTDALQTATSLIDALSSPIAGSVQVDASQPTIAPTYPAGTTTRVITTPAATPTSTIPQPAPTSSAAVAAATIRTTQTLPLHPDQSLFAGMSASQLIEYLKAIVAELSKKMNAGETQKNKRRRHARDVRKAERMGI